MLLRDSLDVAGGKHAGCDDNLPEQKNENHD